MTGLTPDDANREIRRIKTVVEDGDNALAHQMQDQLNARVLEHIAEYGDAASKRLAAIALEANELIYERWYG